MNALENGFIERFVRNAAPISNVRLCPAVSDRGYDYAGHVGIRCGSE